MSDPREILPDGNLPISLDPSPRTATELSPLESFAVDALLQARRIEATTSLAEAQRVAAEISRKARMVLGVPE